jgi:hypothetical protein
MKPRQRAFIAAFRLTFSIKLAAQAARIHRSLHFKWLKSDVPYCAAWADVREQVAQNLMDELVRRAMGIRHQVYYAGKPVRTGRGRSARFVYWTEYSDRCLVECLKIFRPDKYGETVTHDKAADDLVERMAAARRRLTAASTSEA